MNRNYSWKLAFLRWSLVLSSILGTSLISLYKPWFGPAASFFLGIVVVFLIQAEINALFSIGLPAEELFPGVQSTFYRSEPVECWMHEYTMHYDPNTVELSLACPVLVRLEGPILRLWNANSNISRRAMWNEQPIKKKSLTNAREYDISHCQIKLLPTDLSKGKLWKRKYPICIELDKTQISKGVSEDDTSHTSEEYPKDERRPSSESTQSQSQFQIECDDPEQAQDKLFETLIRKGIVDPEEDDEEIVKNVDLHKIPRVNRSSLYLFARSNRLRLFSTTSIRAIVRRDYRQKEEWFRLLQNAARPPDEDTTQLFEEYVQNMAPFVKIVKKTVEEEKTDDPNSSLTTTTTTTSTKPHEPGATITKIIGLPKASCNALIIRALFYTLRGPKWKKYIHMKIQKRLDGMKRPTYMQPFVLTELDLGSTLPSLEGAADPVVDVNGLWVDLELKYRGCFRIVVTTKLNLTTSAERPKTPEENRVTPTEIRNETISVEFTLN